MNLFEEIRNLVIKNLTLMQATGDLPYSLNFDPVAVEPPRDTSHGDLATNAAMVLASQSGKKPKDIALKLAEALNLSPLIANVEIAGPLAPSLCVILCRFRKILVVHDWWFVFFVSHKRRRHPGVAQ